MFFLNFIKLITKFIRRVGDSKQSLLLYLNIFHQTSILFTEMRSALSMVSCLLEVGTRAWQRFDAIPF